MMRITKTKKPNILWLPNNKKIFYTPLVIMGLLLGLNYGLKAQENTKYGTDALKSNTIGFANTANGFQALYFNTAGSENTANGYQALYSNVRGHHNTANGLRALYSNTAGHGNTANGYYALSYNTTGKNNTALGFSAGVAFGFGDLNYATAIGAEAKVTASNTIQLGNDSVTKIFAGVGNTATLITGGLQVTAGMPATGPVLTSDAAGVA
ncbi:MAG TPA: hypothetical protein PK772_07650, partial [Chitinophagaceae bacterium]|nr:hypothetical protein [Chitinophagaceae bacterium]